MSRSKIVKVLILSLPAGKCVAAFPGHSVAQKVISLNYSRTAAITDLIAEPDAAGRVPSLLGN